MSPVTLYQLSRDHNNHFNLLRFLAATGVILSHAFPLSNLQAEPLTHALGFSLGTLCVDVFFVSSGFLVTGSLLARGEIWPFLWARFLRIFPALWVMVLLTLLVLGAWFTTLSLVEYFSHPTTWKYAWRNAISFTGTRFHLPGVFAENPYRQVVNGSLWSLTEEVRLYLLLALTWGLLGLARLRAHFRWVIVGICLALLVAHGINIYQPFYDSPNFRLALLFCMGAALYAHRPSIVHRSCYVPLALALMGVALLAGTPFFALVYALLLPWVVITLVYVRCSPLLAFNRVGDCSYGLYIYAFPVQQCLAAVVVGIAPWPLFFASLGITLALAILSWRWIEQPALRLKTGLR